MPFNIALSGLNAASKDLEVTANNIANTATTGFKGSRAQFAELFNAAGPNLSSSQTGSGVRLTNVAQQFTAGSVETTNNSLDFAISGEGFFTLRDGKGYSYTRAGAFLKDQDGYVTNANGQRLQVFPPAANGSFDNSTMTDLQLLTSQNAAKATSSVQMSLNLPSDAVAPATAFDPVNDPTSFNQSTPFTAYDSLGATHTGVVYFVKDAAANVWNANLYVDGTSTGASQQLTFNSASIRFDDDSLTNKVLDYVGKQQGMSGKDIANQAKAIVPFGMAQLNNPELTAQVTAAVSAYLDDPKSLEISAEPEQPVPFALIMAGAMSNPADLTKTLAVSVTANED